MRHTWKRTFPSLEECKGKCYNGGEEEIKKGCHDPVKGAMKDVHFVKRFSFCSDEESAPGCQAYKVDIRYLIKDKNSFEDESDCMNQCRLVFNTEEIKPCNSTFQN